MSFEHSVHTRLRGPFRLPILRQYAHGLGEGWAGQKFIYLRGRELAALVCTLLGDERDGPSMLNWQFPRP